MSTVKYALASCALRLQLSAQYCSTPVYFNTKDKDKIVVVRGSYSGQTMLFHVSRIALGYTKAINHIPKRVEKISGHGY